MAHDHLQLVVDRLPIEVLPLSALRMGDSPRLSGPDEEHAETLAQTEDRLAPILVHRPSMQIIDGMHRVRAASLRGEREVEARLFDGDEKTAFVLAVTSNVAHGLPLTLADRTQAAARILGFFPDWSDRAIARATGLSAPTVAAIRRRSTVNSEQSNVRLGRDGRARPVNSAEGRRLAGELIARYPNASLREIARKAGVSPATVRDVRRRLALGHDPVPPSQREIGRSRHPAGRARRGAARSRRGDKAKRPTEIINRLSKDPSLRLNERGRNLLKWLSVNSTGAEKWPKYLDHLPLHCTIVVIEAARGLARTWSEFADELEHRVAKIDAD